jgi:hypothetical protein
MPVRVRELLTKDETSMLRERVGVVRAALAEVGYSVEVKCERGVVRIRGGNTVPPATMAKALAVAGLPESLITKSFDRIVY